MADITDSLYTKKVPIDPNQYEIVLSFFKSVTSNLKTAKSYAQNLFDVAAYSENDVMALLATMEGKNGLQVSSIMAYYLNTFSDKTVMYGASAVVQPVAFVSRNIVQ
jgi:hypothetical protein